MGVPANRCSRAPPPRASPPMKSIHSFSLAHHPRRLGAGPQCVLRLAPRLRNAGGDKRASPRGLWAHHDHGMAITRAGANRRLAAQIAPEHRPRRSMAFGPSSPEGPGNRHRTSVRLDSYRVNSGSTLPLRGHRSLGKVSHAADSKRKVFVGPSGSQCRHLRGGHLSRIPATSILRHHSEYTRRNLSFGRVVRSKPRVPGPSSRSPDRLRWFDGRHTCVVEAFGTARNDRTHAAGYAGSCRRALTRLTAHHIRASRRSTDRSTQWIEPPSPSSPPAPHAAAYGPRNAPATRPHWSAASSAQPRAPPHNSPAQSPAPVPSPTQSPAQTQQTNPLARPHPPSRLFMEASCSSFNCCPSAYVSSRSRLRTICRI